MSEAIIIDLKRTITSLDPADYSDIFTLFSDHSIIIPSKKLNAWRLVKPSHAMIRGLFHLGDVTALATDGVQVLVHTPKYDYPIMVSRSNYLGELEGRGQGPKQHFHSEAEADEGETQKTKKQKKTKTELQTERLASLFAELDI